MPRRDAHWDTADVVVVVAAEPGAGVTFGVASGVFNGT
jgi:hypothetical protein